MSCHFNHHFKKIKGIINVYIYNLNVILNVNMHGEEPFVHSLLARGT